MVDAEEYASALDVLFYIIVINTLSGQCIAAYVYERSRYPREDMGVCEEAFPC